MEWKDLKINQAQHLYHLSNSMVDDHAKFEGELKALSYLTGTPEEEINGWDLPRYSKELEAIAFMHQPIPKTTLKRKFTVNNQRYIVNYDVRQVVYVTYNEVMKECQGASGIINNLHRLMATVVTPINQFGIKQSRTHQQISEDMLDAPFLECYSVSIFFYKTYKEFLKTIPDYLENELKQKGMSKEEAKQAVETLYQVL